MTTVEFCVWDKIKQEIERRPGETDDELIQRAINLAAEEQPKVAWMVDEGIEPEIIEED